MGAMNTASASATFFYMPEMLASVDTTRAQPTGPQTASTAGVRFTYGAATGKRAAR
jgi:hypothetical protein